MSMSLRDQLLAAGLVSQKQVKDAERQKQHQQRQHHGPKRKDSAAAPVVAPRPPAQNAKVVRDQALNRQQQEKAQKKALLAQIKQLVEQNRLAPIEGGDAYNFVDGSKIRRIAVNAEVRARITRGELAIVRHGGGYDLVPKAIAERIRERDPHAVVAAGPAAPPQDAVQPDDPYKEFAVPDDLMW
jgi:hypothetical protein